MKYLSLLSIVVILTLSFACRSRLRPVLYETGNGAKHSLINESCYYLDQAVLSIDPAENPIKPGRGKVLITSQMLERPDRDEIKTGLIKTVSGIEYRIYIELPEYLKIDSLDIADKSICRIIGDYYLDEDLKRYLCHEGFLKIDSLKSKSFHAHLFGKYFNSEKDSLILDGDLNVKNKK